jgi:uncharacterized protein (DUF1778 family)
MRYLEITDRIQMNTKNLVAAAAAAHSTTTSMFTMAMTLL